MLESKHSAEPRVAPQVSEIGLPGICGNLSLSARCAAGRRTWYARNICPASYLGADYCIGLEFFIGIRDGIPIHTESFGKIAARRQPVADLECAACDHLPHSADDLGIKWHVTIAIELKYQRSLPP